MNKDKPTNIPLWATTQIEKMRAESIVDIIAIKNSVRIRNNELERVADHLEAVTNWMLSEPQSEGRDKALGQMVLALQALQGGYNEPQG